MNSAPCEFQSDLGESPSQKSDLVANLDTISGPQTRLEQKPRILVVEDHPFVREGIVALINGQADLICCGESDSIADTLAVMTEQKPNLVLLDLRLKDGEAFELIKMLKLQFPEVAVLILSQCDEALYAEKALRVGAKGYIMKQEAAEDLLDAIRTVLLGKIYVSRAMKGQLLDKLYQS
jgi:DNA-binding NarL/FixJ family response regulator